ncbi:restriction endonuclease subunit S [Cronobacter dublinensis subsp. dublinensis]|nr:restriction endonuclease subunit S [Cronobacter dublinensis subsp. dublinensis]EGT5735849.1 restriction endonuclease subunit S [Cronobacter dublinensis subsp. dublinensis]
MAKYQAYPEYKNSGVEWLGEIPEHWKLSKLRYQFFFNKGLTITKEHLQDEGIPCVSYGEVHSKYGFEVDPEIHTLKCVSDKHLKENSNALLEKGDIVFADTSEDIDGSGNFTQLVSDTVTFAGYHTIIARPFERDCCRFYAYLLDCKELRSQVRHAVKGVKVFSITQAILRNLSIWLPSKDEQEQIAVFLDHETAKIDNLIEKQQQLIELLKEKRQAVISHSVTKGLNPDVPMKDSGVEWLGEIPSHWELKRLAYIGSARNGLTYSPENITDQESGVLVLRSSNIQNSSLCFDDNVYVDSIIPEQFLVKENDLLICSRNGSRNLIGKNALIMKDAEGMAFGAFMAIFRSQINTYIFWVLNSPLFDYQSGSFLTSTINQLTIGNLNSMEIPVPTLEDQKEIARYLSRKNDDFIALINKVKNSIALLQERRIALISAAVTGKIDVRDWRAPDAQKTEEPQEATI